MLVRMWSDRNSHLWLVGMQNDTATLEDSLAVSYKTKHTPTTQSSNYIPWYLFSNKLKTSVHTKTSTQMFIAALSITAKPLEATKISFSSSMDNLSAGYTDSGILFSGEKKSHRAMQKYGRNLNAY